VPGLIAVFNKSQIDDDTKQAAIAEKISQLLYDKDKFTEIVVQKPGISAKIIDNPTGYHGVIADDRFLIMWYGQLFYKERLINKDQIEDIYNDLFVDCSFSSLTGQFSLIGYDIAKRSLLSIADKVSSHPTYFVETPQYVILSPEPLSFRGLRQFGWKPTIREGAIYEFLAVGNLWGDGTFWQEVKRLGPGQYLTCDTDKTVARFYWKMEYSPQAKMNYVSEFYSAVTSDLEKLPSGGGALMLSGGLESKGLLGLMHRAHIDFEAISYSFGEDFDEGSDGLVGKYFADKLGVTHHLYKPDITNGPELIKRFEDAVVATGGEIDEALSEDALLGECFYERLEKEFDYFVRGDAAWGAAMPSYAFNSQQAFFANYLLNLDEFRQPATILAKDKYVAGVRHLKSKRREYEAEYPTIHNYNDLKDYLYWRLRLSRGMAYVRRRGIVHIAPFVLDNTLAVLRQLPIRLRIRKRLYRQVMEKEFPELFLDKHHTSPYMPDVTPFDIIYQNEKIRQFIIGCVLTDPPECLRNFFQYENLKSWMDSTFQSERKRHQNAYLWNVFKYINKTLQKNDIIVGLAHYVALKLFRIGFPTQDQNFLFRLFVLSLALKEYEKLEH